jgi:hypothetical protein
LKRKIADSIQLAREPLPMRKISGTILFVAALICLFTINAAAQSESSGMGPRVGLTGDPGLWFVGIHYETRPLAKQFALRPNFLYGRSIDSMGKDVSAEMMVGGVELVYKIPIFESAAAIYLGGGPSVSVFRDNESDERRAGGSFLIGVEHAGGWFEELKFGGGGGPRVQFTVGYTFRFHKKR